MAMTTQNHNNHGEDEVVAAVDGTLGYLQKIVAGLHISATVGLAVFAWNTLDKLHDTQTRLAIVERVQQVQIDMNNKQDVTIANALAAMSSAIVDVRRDVQHNLDLLMEHDREITRTPRSKWPDGR
jgi:hypothetical protein